MGKKSNVQAMKTLDGICRKAVSCRSCFSDFNLFPADIDIAQPRWVGPKYWQSHKKLVVIMINPGSGNFRNDSGARKTRDLLREYYKENKSLNEVFRFQRVDMENWGRGRRFLNFFENSFDLDLKEIGFMNLAWCATKDNQYPSIMLNECFWKHGIPLLQMLEPDYVLLCGSKTHRFSGNIEECLPNSKTIPTLHYAHREGYDREASEASRIKAVLAK